MRNCLSQPVDCANSHYLRLLSADPRLFEDLCIYDRRRPHRAFTQQPRFWMIWREPLVSMEVPRHPDRNPARNRRRDFSELQSMHGLC